MNDIIEFYSGSPGQKWAAQPEFPPSIHDLLRRHETYVPDDGLKSAVNVALLLGLPLLVTGPPGSGKTRLAYALAAELNLGEPLEVIVKSDATSRDLLYLFDELGRFQDAQATGGASSRSHEAAIRPLRAYLRFQPLGRAILRAGGPNAPVELLDGHAFRGRHRNEVPKTFGELAPDVFHEFPDPTVQLVLIDELDKAPRDLPNDLLRELEDMAFEIKELGVRIRVPRGDAKVPLRPILVITSNAERSLPEPFLRRVAFYDIPDPTKQRLVDMLNLRFAEIKSSQSITNSVDFFRAIADNLPPGERKPGTAEFLAWFSYLRRKGLGSGSVVQPTDIPDALRASLVILAKTRESLTALTEQVDAELGTAKQG